MAAIWVYAFIFRRKEGEGKRKREKILRGHVSHETGVGVEGAEDGASLGAFVGEHVGLHMAMWVFLCAL